MENEPRLKIAVVEDEEALQRVLCEWLESEGYQAIGITTGPEAVRRIPQEKPALILLDIILPELNGFEVMKILKDNPATANIPIVVLSNLGDGEQQARASALGAASYLIKAEHDFASMKKIINGTLRKDQTG
ncbi:MAG: response regulator [Candidatus Doudnabacteria bacterium]|nr:response regulator [Candidatus Doudnabacteria bacterium]